MRTGNDPHRRRPIVSRSERAPSARRSIDISAGLARVIADYEAELGTITEVEMLAQQRADRRTAIRIRRTRR